MSKNKNKQNDVIEQEYINSSKELEIPVTVEFKTVALGISKNKEGRFVLVEIPYDLESGDVGFIKELSIDVFEDIADRFKINAAEKILTRSKD